MGVVEDLLARLEETSPETRRVWEVLTAAWAMDHRPGCSPGGLAWAR